MTLANHPLFAVPQARKFSAPVDVSMPNEDCGFDRTKFKASFAYKTRGELAELAKKSVPDQMLEVLIGWDLADSTGTPVLCDTAHKEAIMQHTAAWRGLSEAYFSHLGGAAAKN